MGIEVRLAAAADVDTVSSILLEAANWLEERDMPMWRANELRPERITKDVREGLFFLGEHTGEPAGTIKFQLADLEFWPDVPRKRKRVHPSASRTAAIRRWHRFLGPAVVGSRTNSVAWPAILRLDCEASRRRLRAVYERFGFQHHSDRQVGPYFVSRYEFKLSNSIDESIG